MKLLLKTYILIPLSVVSIAWIVFAFQQQPGNNLSEWGIFPQTVLGLRGIVFSPFLHGNFQHIIFNTPPLFVSLMMIWFFYKPVALKLSVFMALTAGFLVWIVGRPVYHIGASGIIYAYIFFVLSSGLIRHNRRLSVLSLLIILMYGSMVWGIVPQGGNISWESHLCGALTGIVFAFIYRKSGPAEDTIVHEESESSNTDEYQQFHVK
ncbi:MAG: rhomboid family intramembrane serine protease [Bacteroidia bacterium]|nr:rhomboid family intramembrane serine protease [Bacteroidia bacterium]